MPFKSQAQAAFLEHHPEKIGGKAALTEWENATRGKHLPKRAGKWRAAAESRANGR